MDIDISKTALESAGEEDSTFVFNSKVLQHAVRVLFPHYITWEA
jgi:hypothetical protein